MGLRSWTIYAALAAAGVALDQWIKWLVETRLTMHEPVELLPFLALYRTYNTGVAFSMFSWVGDKGLIVVSLAVIAFVLYLAAKSDPRQMLARIGFALVISGALGNLIDRAIYGHVIDYILFHTPVWSFAVFNLADAFITVGAAAIVLQEFLGWLNARKTASSDN
ncbi:signal peptidase II [Mesorhizobium sp. LHD-90]|uniref:signal peptidase II n=1 Tax=Mesorhizobium sp. LHD-90 TaxID=3071414 RepID=UPI0027DEF033|nr:signal peptidase II [Mesorhizobium sp. LHD-90]MDQ6434652.1 signal peptidase II [Mesorhizobium sp. LHD-90]